MKEVNLQNDPIKSPEIQEIILSNRIGIIAAELSKRLARPLRISKRQRRRLLRHVRKRQHLHGSAFPQRNFARQKETF